MEHRHDHQHRIALRQANHVGLQGDQGVQEVGAMRIEHTLGIACGAGGVAEATGRQLAEAPPNRIGRQTGDQGFVHNHILARAFRTVGFVRQDDDLLDGRRLVQIGKQHGRKGQVGEDDLVASMVGDPQDLIRMQAGIERMADRPHAHNAIPNLDMIGCVPGQRADAIAKPDAQGLQGVGHLFGPAMNGAPIGPDDGAFH